MGLSESKLSSVNARKSNMHVLQKVSTVSQTEMERKEKLILMSDNLKEIWVKMLVHGEYIYIHTVSTRSWSLYNSWSWYLLNFLFYLCAWVLSQSMIHFISFFSKAPSYYFPTLPFGESQLVLYRVLNYDMCIMLTVMCISLGMVHP